MRYSVLLPVVIASYGWSVLGQSTWCGKNYMNTQPIVPPGGQFPVIETSSEPLLAFRCTPAVRPYLDGESTASVIIDTGLTHTKVAGSIPFTVKGSGDLAVTISINGRTMVQGSVPINATGHEMSFSLKSLKPQKDAFEISCVGKAHDGQSFKATNSMTFLPKPSSGSVTKMDLRTGALLVQNGAAWDTVFPIGFYTSFDGYIATNLSLLNDLKDRGFTIVHPVPTFDNLTALELVLDRMEEVGLYLMYDMRFTYMNLTSVTEQVNMIKSRKNLLLWYTGDEPDGTSDPLNATKITYDLIYELDGYHPVSLVLNCQDYFFPEYTRGTDIVMQDTYPISINATFSIKWDTPCTPDYGDCGCDNCKGSLADISDRMDEFAQRLRFLGDERNKAVWGVPQAFGGEDYWPRPPTGAEWIVESVLSINHGALGIVPWQDPNPQDIKDAATTLAKAMPTIKAFLFDPKVSLTNFSIEGVDVGIWVSGSQTLLLATNLNYATQEISFVLPSKKSPKSTEEVLNFGGSIITGPKGAISLTMQSVGTVGYILA